MIGCSNDFDDFQFRSGESSAGGASSGGATSGGGSSAGGSGGSVGGAAGGGGVLTGGGGAPTGGGGAPTGGGGAPTGGGGAPTGGGGAPTGGGGAPTGGGGAPTGGGGAPTGGGGGPTGGAGGTGGATTLPTCDDTYGAINGVAQICLQTDSTCELAYAATTQTCTAICQQGGGVCQGVFNNQPGACGHGTPSNCDNNLFNDAVCVCSRGCGSGPPCPGNQTCNAGQCQGG